MNSLCSRIHCVAKLHYVADFKFLILLPLPPKLSAGFIGMDLHTQFSVVLGMEPRASCMLGKTSLIEPYPQSSSVDFKKYF